MRSIRIILPFLILSACGSESTTAEKVESDESVSIEGPYMVVLGNVQDAGSPHTGCDKDCCRDLFANPDPGRRVVSLGLIDPQHKTHYLFEATPDLPIQMKELKRMADSESEVPDGIFLTHAHIGHYAGLMYLGKESMYSYKVPVYTMPRMKEYLEANGPWDLLVENSNIEIQELRNGEELELSTGITVTPFLVPHRDEYSETVGYRIKGPNRSVLFIPDIDKWEKWEQAIADELTTVDYALIDGTFFDGNELPNRDISEVPHPFIIESMKLFGSLSEEERAKIWFIHFNHTNPLLDPNSIQSKEVEAAGYHIARLNEILEL